MRKGFNNEVQVKIDLMGLLGKGGEGDSPTGKSLPFSYSFPSAVAARGWKLPLVDSGCFISSQKLRRLWHQCFLSGFLECSCAGLNSLLHHRLWGNWSGLTRQQENLVSPRCGLCLSELLGELQCWKGKINLKRKKKSFLVSGRSRI